MRVCLGTPMRALVCQRESAPAGGEGLALRGAADSQRTSRAGACPRSCRSWSIRRPSGGAGRQRRVVDGYERVRVLHRLVQDAVQAAGGMLRELGAG
jgi:hypothetical protein